MSAGHRAAKLCTAWWGVDAQEITIDVPKDPMDLAESWPSQAYITLDESCASIPLGKILLRQEYITAREFIEETASSFPDRGTVVTGQPGVG